MADKDTNNSENNKTPFWKKHFVSLFLFLLIIVGTVWALIERNQMIKEHKTEITTLKSIHQKEMDSMVLEKAKLLTSTLALAVRSELIDENKDQVDQYFIQVIKNPQVEKIMLVDQTSGEVMISTNRKDLQTKYTNSKLLKAKDVITEIEDNFITTASPVMGLNTQLALLVVKTKK
ncbi:MAG: hypothetical protein R3277_03715 [Brumimicrobium sp.]|nr:hypothetical protein [Brumimicrobium sp.]